MTPPEITRLHTKKDLQLHHTYANDAHDMSGTFNNGTLFTGRALDFDGLDDYVDTNLDINLSGGGDFTAVIWAKFGVDENYIMAQAKTLDPYSSDWIISQENNIFWMRSVTLGDITAYEDNNWHRIVFIWDSTSEKYKGYVDNTYIGESAVVSGYNGTGTVKLATRGDATSAFFGGVLSNAQIWDAKWDANDVAYDFAHPEATPDDIARHSAGLSLSNCKAWYPLIEGNGSVVYDGSGNQNHGTITGATWASGLSGNPQTALMGQSRPMVFDGVDDGVDLNHHFNDVFSAGSWSMSAWVILSEGYAIDGMITDKYTGHKFEVLSSKLPKISIYVPSYYGVTGVTALNENELYHLTITYDGTTFKLYVNGALDNSNAESNKYHNDTGHNFEIGKAGDFGAGFFDGFIGDVTYWNTALDADEVSELYNSGTPLNALNHSQAENLVGYWRNDGDGTWVDRAGSNDGTVNGTPDVIMLPEGESGRDSQGFFLTNPREASLNLAGDGYALVDMNIGTIHTVSCWVYTPFDATSGNNGALFYSNSGDSYPMRFYSGTIRYQTSTGGTSYFAVTPNNTEGQWTYLTVVRNGLSIEFFQDAVSIGSGSLTINADQFIHKIGGKANVFYGDKIDEPKIYNRALSLAEIQRNYLSGKAKHR